MNLYCLVDHYSINKIASYFIAAVVTAKNISNVNYLNLMH